MIRSVPRGSLRRIIDIARALKSAKSRAAAAAIPPPGAGGRGGGPARGGPWGLVVGTFGSPGRTAKRNPPPTPGETPPPPKKGRGGPPPPGGGGGGGGGGPSNKRGGGGEGPVPSVFFRGTTEQARDHRWETEGGIFGAAIGSRLGRFALPQGQQAEAARERGDLGGEAPGSRPRGEGAKDEAAQAGCFAAVSSSSSMGTGPRPREGFEMGPARAAAANGFAPEADSRRNGVDRHVRGGHRHGIVVHTRTRRPARCAGAGDRTGRGSLYGRNREVEDCER